MPSSSPHLPETGSRVNEDTDPIDGRERTRNEGGAGRRNEDTAIDAPIITPEVSSIQEEPVSSGATPEQQVPGETTEAMTASTSHLVLPQGDDQAKVDKLDKNSVATTLTSTLVHSQQTRESQRRANQTSTSEGTSSSVVAEKQKTSPQRQKSSSLLGSIFRRILPCLGPLRGHETDIGDMDNLGLGTTDTEKQDATDGSDRITVDPSTGLSTSDALPSTSLTIPSALLPPPTSTDSEIIIPGRQLLPLCDTEGVTSGAVQPPGSTGDPITMGNIADLEEEGDDDVEFEDVLEDDEEDRLIRSGGNGIPIGDVSALVVFFFLCLWQEHSLADRL
jgi:carboxy-terminal domain RNA polymerase II polypeptide A small phosphatase